MTFLKIDSKVICLHKFLPIHLASRTVSLPRGGYPLWSQWRKMPPNPPYFIPLSFSLPFLPLLFPFPPQSFSIALPEIQLRSLGERCKLLQPDPSQNAPRGSIFQLPQHFLWRNMRHSPLGLDAREFTWYLTKHFYCIIILYCQCNTLVHTSAKQLVAH